MYFEYTKVLPKWNNLNYNSLLYSTVNKASNTPLGHF